MPANLAESQKSSDKMCALTVLSRLFVFVGRPAAFRHDRQADTPGGHAPHADGLELFFRKIDKESSENGLFALRNYDYDTDQL
jgi:hypothetical protein